MTTAVFQATYSDWRLIKTRHVVQLIFEVPIEGAHSAYEVLGGMPDPSKSVWCAIARLNSGPTEEPFSESPKADESPSPSAPLIPRWGTP